MNPVGTGRREAHVPVNTDKIVGGSRLLGEMRDLIRRKHYSIRTEQAYLEWAKRYILFHGKRHPKDMGAPEIVAFLTDLAVARYVAASTQNQALNALVFLYKQVLGREDLELANIAPAKRPERLPSVFDRGEIQRLFSQLASGSSNGRSNKRSSPPAFTSPAVVIGYGPASPPICRNSSVTAMCGPP